MQAPVPHLPFPRARAPCCLVEGRGEVLCWAGRAPSEPRRGARMACGVGRLGPRCPSDLPQGAELAGALWHAWYVKARKTKVANIIIIFLLEYSDYKNKTCFL